MTVKLGVDGKTHVQPEYMHVHWAGTRNAERGNGTAAEKEKNKCTRNVCHNVYTKLLFQI